MHPILKASRKILTFKYYAKFVFIQIRDSMGAHLIFFIIFTLFSCIILTNQSLPWSSLRSGFQCDTKMAAVFSCMRPALVPLCFIFKSRPLRPLVPYVLRPNQQFYFCGISLSHTNPDSTEPLP